MVTAAAEIKRNSNGTLARPVDLRKRNVPGVCAYIKCGEEFIGYVGKRFCHDAHRVLQWNLDNPDAARDRRRKKRAIIKV